MFFWDKPLKWVLTEHLSFSSTPPGLPRLAGNHGVREKDETTRDKENLKRRSLKKKEEKKLELLTQAFKNQDIK